MKSYKKTCKALLFMLFMAFFLAANDRDFVVAGSRDTIEEGVYAENVNLSGLTEKEAQEKIGEYAESLAKSSITLVCVGGNTVEIAPSELGVEWQDTGIARKAANLGKNGGLIKRFKELTDLKRENKVFEIEFSASDQKILSVLHEKCASFDEAAVDAALEPGNNGSFTIREGKNGQSVDIDSSLERIKTYIKDSLRPGENRIELPIKETEPKGDSETLSKIKDRLGTFTTAYPRSSSDRCANISAGCSHVNGTILYPGEQFSMYKHVSPFTEENGYHLAGSYLNGLVVESLGGGICQVSSTLYQAVLRAELQVDQRSNHSMVVDYVPHSGDAAIAGTTKDFKFTNNTKYPIYIAGSTGGKEITFTIYGVDERPDNRTLDFESIDTATEEPEGVKVIGDPGQNAGFAKLQGAHTGYSSEFWKIIKVDGKEESRERVNKSYYKATPKTLTLGTATDNPITKSAISAAIASQDIDYARAVAASISKD
ncbi:MAG: VanW family protein, partial [Lachnospiraceae bacterium]|nr:VanW family protein [Lachnospiraceae bacterium]